MRYDDYVLKKPRFRLDKILVGTDFKKCKNPEPFLRNVKTVWKMEDQEVYIYYVKFSDCKLQHLAIYDKRNGGSISYFKVEGAKKEEGRADFIETAKKRYKLRRMN